MNKACEHEFLDLTLSTDTAHYEDRCLKCGRSVYLYAKQLESRCARLETSLARYREALQKYADEKNWSEEYGFRINGFVNSAIGKLGHSWYKHELARQAINKKEE